MAIVGALLPHALHLSAAGLEIAKVLLAEAGLFVDLDIGAAEWRRIGIVRGQSGKDTLGGLAGATVGGGENLEGVVGAKKVAEAAAGIVGLIPTLGRELDAVIGDGLVDITVFCREKRRIVRLERDGWNWDREAYCFLRIARGEPR